MTEILVLIFPQNMKAFRLSFKFSPQLRPLSFFCLNYEQHNKYYPILKREPNLLYRRVGH